MDCNNSEDYPDNGHEHGREHRAYPRGRYKEKDVRVREGQRPVYCCLKPDIIENIPYCKRVKEVTYLLHFRPADKQGERYEHYHSRGLAAYFNCKHPVRNQAEREDKALRVIRRAQVHHHGGLNKGHGNPEYGDYNKLLAHIY